MDVARAAVQSGALRQQRPKRKAVVGSKVNDKLKPVTTRRCVEVFISRLHPDTSAACWTVHYWRSDDWWWFQYWWCAYWYWASTDQAYHVTVTVCSDSFSRTIEILMSSSSWPEGILVRRFYPKREQNGWCCPRPAVVYIQLSLNEEQLYTWYSWVMSFTWSCIIAMLGHKVITIARVL